MSVIEAGYFDGKSSVKRPVGIVVSRGRMKIIGRDLEQEFDARLVRRSLRIANTPRWLYLPGGGSRNPATRETVDARMHYAKMKGNEVFKVAVRLFVDCAERILARNGFTAADVNLFIPHQANLRIIEAAAKRVDLPMERVFVNVDRYGNTGAASVYVALEEAIAAGRLKRGDLVLIVALGGGFAWGAALMRW